MVCKLRHTSTAVSPPTKINPSYSLRSIQFSTSPSLEARLLPACRTATSSSANPVWLQNKLSKANIAPHSCRSSSDSFCAAREISAGAGPCSRHSEFNKTLCSPQTASKRRTCAAVSFFREPVTTKTRLAVGRRGTLDSPPLTGSASASAALPQYTGGASSVCPISATSDRSASVTASIRHRSGASLRTRAEARPAPSVRRRSSEMWQTVMCARFLNKVSRSLAEPSGRWSTPPSTVRPILGKLGAANAIRRPAASSAASNSSTGFPRISESTFLKSVS